MDHSDSTKRGHARVAKIRNGDRAAFEALFRTYAEPLCDFVEGYVETPEVAEELVQDLFLKIWSQRETWDVQRSVKSYLYTAARNRALDHLKHRRVVDRWEEEQARRHDNAYRPPRPVKDLQHEQLRKEVQQAIEHLTERRRLVFSLSRHHDLTYKEIAAILDLSVRTVETHMREALKSLRDLLSSHLTESVPG